MASQTEETEVENRSSSKAEDDALNGNLQKSEGQTLSTPDGTFHKTTLKEGHFFLRPLLESVCCLDIQCSNGTQGEGDRVGDAMTEDQLSKLGINVGDKIELTLGWAETKVMKLIEACIMTMRRDEVCKCVMKIPIDLFSQSREEKTENAERTVTLLLKLHNFTDVQPLCQLSSDEKYNLALIHKDTGTCFFKDGKAEAAFYQYSVAVKYLISIQECSSLLVTDLDPEVKERIEKYEALKCICYLNLAACQAKVESHKGVIANCTKALAIEPGNVKGLYRRAQAYKECGKLDLACSDLKKALKTEPGNKTVMLLLSSCQVGSPNKD